MSNPRKFVIGDIHGHYDEMLEIFELAGFRSDRDSLISLGDLVDRGPEPIAVVEKLMQVKNLTHILGNHDEWCYQYLKNNKIPIEWVSQGGQATLDAYRKKPGIRKKHIDFFEKAELFFIDAENILFVHGGYNPRVPFRLQKNNKELLIWDRSLLQAARKNAQTNQTFAEFSEIFIGHTPTQLLGGSAPIKITNLWMLDTGIAHGGKLTLMDIDTKEYWQANAKAY